MTAFLARPFPEVLHKERKPQICAGLIALFDVRGAYLAR